MAFKYTLYEKENEAMNNAIVEESNSILELDSDTETSLLETYKSLPKNTDKNNQPKSPESPSILWSLRKRPKQSRLAFYPVKNNENISLSVDKHKAVNILRSAVIQDVSTANATANATVTKNSATTEVNNSSEISDDDVIEASPTQISVASKVKEFLKLKRKIPIRRIDFGSCPSPKHTCMQIKDDKSLMNTTVNTKKSIEAQKEDELLINKIKNDKVLIQNINDMDNFNLDDTENKPPKKRCNWISLTRSKKRTFQSSLRCKADREKYDDRDCWECREYYTNLELSEKELQKRKNQSSRHRHKYERPVTPEGFWDPEFPETLGTY